MFLIIDYIASQYHKQNFFHGDIKPENIFIWDKMRNLHQWCTLDIGSLLYLGDANEKDNAKFIVT